MSPEGEPPNGFLALAVFDQAAEGGNGDGLIDASDRVFARLRVWLDRNHNGYSERDELVDLVSAGLGRIDLLYKNKKRMDEHGNLFVYRGRVWNAVGKQSGWAWDVFLKSDR